MNELKTARVLDVGQCGPDHSMIRSLVQMNFNAVVERAMTVEAAMEALRREPFDLVLVNRIIDCDGSQGIELVRRAQTDPTLREVPVMLVSDFPQAQSDAVALGAEPGFGKSDLFSRSTLDRLADHLPARSR